MATCHHIFDSSHLELFVLVAANSPSNATRIPWGISHLLEKMMNKMLDVQFYLNAAQQHGEDSEPDHEVGDLQDFLRAAWGLLSKAQKRQFSKLPTVRSTLEGALVDLDDDDDDSESTESLYGDRDYKLLFGEVVAGLKEFHPILRNMVFLPALRTVLRDQAGNSGNRQKDYEALRDVVEARLNNVTWEDIPDGDQGLLVRSLKKGNDYIPSEQEMKSLIQDWHDWHILKTVTVLPHRVRWYLKGADAPHELDAVTVENILAAVNDGFKEGELCLYGNGTIYRGYWLI